LFDPALLAELERGAEEAGIRRIPTNGLVDHPVVRETLAQHGIWSARGYRAVAEGPFGHLRLVVLLHPRIAEEPIVLCLDGPAGAGVASPHRNGTAGAAGHELCLYFPGDPPSRRWLPDDGLPALVELARIHLWCEDEWRSRGTWPRAEAPHGWDAAARSA
jgi:hypothetical protein